MHLKGVAKLLLGHVRRHVAESSALGHICHHGWIAPHQVEGGITGGRAKCGNVVQRPPGVVQQHTASAILASAPLLQLPLWPFHPIHRADQWWTAHHDHVQPFRVSSSGACKGY